MPPARFEQVSAQDQQPSHWQKFGLASVTQPAEGLRIATDDWPFFYLKSRSYPWSYMAVLASCILSSSVLFRRELSMGKGFNWASFFFGAAFFLAPPFFAVAILCISFR